MFRLWGRIIKEGRIVKSMTVERPEDDTRTHKILAAVSELCREWDLENPIWLDSTIASFKRHSKARFYNDSFIEKIDFDYMEIEIMEE